MSLSSFTSHFVSLLVVSLLFSLLLYLITYIILSSGINIGIHSNLFGFSNGRNKSLEATATVSLLCVTSFTHLLWCFFPSGAQSRKDWSVYVDNHKTITIRLSSAFFESLKQLSGKMQLTVLNPLSSIDEEKSVVSVISMTKRKFGYFGKWCWKIVSKSFIKFKGMLATIFCIDLNTHSDRKWIFIKLWKIYLKKLFL